MKPEIYQSQREAIETLRAHADGSLPEEAEDKDIRFVNKLPLHVLGISNGKNKGARISDMDVLVLSERKTNRNPVIKKQHQPATTQSCSVLPEVMNIKN